MINITNKELYKGPIIDAHHHFWDPIKNDHPWLKPDVMIPFRYGDYSAIKRPYYPKDYFEDAKAHHVVETIYMETEWNPLDPIGETQFISEIAHQTGYPNALVGQAWLDHEDIHDVLREQASYRLMRSVRHKPEGPTKPSEVGQIKTLMSSDQWRKGFALLKEVGLHFDLQTPWWNMPEAIDLARSFPETLIIINHTGLPSDRTAEGLKAWHMNMSKIAECQNVYLKISGIGLKDIPWTLENNEWIIKESISIFSPKRIMFASNFPVDSVCGTFDQIFTGFKKAVIDFSYEEQKNMFFDNAKSIYKTIAPEIIRKDML